MEGFHLTQLTHWLNEYGVDTPYLVTLLKALGLIVFIAIVVHFVLHYLVFLLKRRAERESTTWRGVLFSSKLFSRIAFIIQGVIVGIQANLWLLPESQLRYGIGLLVSLWTIWFSLLSVYSAMDIIDALLSRTTVAKNLPIRGIMQSLKLLFFIVAGLLILSLLLGQSPAILLSGLGAMTAVLMLVFKDPILGLVAGIQLSANKMLSVGDWLEMPKYGADGDVIDISLTTVKVRNWDKTITTVPTYALISDSFKNWKGMQESGGRRIKRSVLIDTSSVRFLNEADIQALTRAYLLAPYLKEKVTEIEHYNRERSFDEACVMNGRRLTNLGSFRAYLERYLRENPGIHQGMTLMVRQLAPTHEGIALELYCFTSTVAWVDYERIQSDVFDHLYAVLPEFGLRPAQAPTGYDFQRAWALNSQPVEQKTVIK